MFAMVAWSPATTPERRPARRATTITKLAEEPEMVARAKNPADVDSSPEMSAIVCFPGLEGESCLVAGF